MYFFNNVIEGVTTKFCRQQTLKNIKLEMGYYRSLQPQT